MELPESPNAIVTIANAPFFIAVFTLVVSLKYHRVRAQIHVLSLGLTTTQKAWLEQFPAVTVHEADPASKLGPAARKGEAILTAEDSDCNYVTLLDGDCIVTGDITPYLSPEGDALFARLKSPAEDARVFARRYEPDERPGTIPRRILETWKADLGSKRAVRHQQHRVRWQPDRTQVAITIYTPMVTADRKDPASLGARSA